MDLYVWEGEPKWGLPSIDLKSLQMLAYVKFSGAPVTVHKSSNPYKSPGGDLPSFKCTEGLFTDFSSFSMFLRKQNYSCDYELSAKQCSKVLAYEQLLKEKLYPALVYLWWVEPKSYYDIIHKWYYRNMPFPYKFWYPGKYHKNHVEFIKCIFDEPEDEQLVETEVHKQAQECLTMLSNRLGEKDYFFGRSPSTIDAIIFSYLVLLLKVDLKVPVLQNHIKACPNLSKYVNRILQRYFPSVARAESFDRNQKAKSSLKNETVTLDDVPNKGRNMILSGLVAFGAMLGYAVATGLVQVDMREQFEEETVEDDYSYEDYSNSDYQENDSGGE